jgi:hypothetical protein
MSTNDTYRALASGDPGMVRKFAPRVAALAAAARKQRASAPSPATSAPRVPAAIAASARAPAAAPRPSRAAQVAEIHLAGVNESRKRCGLAPLSAAELEHEFEELDRLPPPRTKARRPSSNSNHAADPMWSDIVGKLNASLPASRTPVGAARTSPAGGTNPTQASSDAMWAGLARNLNDEAGLATPARAR